MSDIIPETDDLKYNLVFHVYGTGAIDLFESTVPAGPLPPEIFFLVECIADEAETAKAVIGVTKQYLLHHGFEGRLSTGGNIAFPFTPPEISAGSAYRFTIYHVTECDNLPVIFPVHTENVNRQGGDG